MKICKIWSEVKKINYCLWVKYLQFITNYVSVLLDGVLFQMFIIILYLCIYIQKKTLHNDNTVQLCTVSYILRAAVHWQYIDALQIFTSFSYQSFLRHDIYGHFSLVSGPRSQTEQSSLSLSRLVWNDRKQLVCQNFIKV